MGSMSQRERARGRFVIHREREEALTRASTGLRPLSSRGGLRERERVGAGLGEGVGLRAR